MTVRARRWIETLLLVSAVSLLAACGGSTLHVQNPGGGSQQNVSISITPSSTASQPMAIQVNGTASLTATVTNNSQNLGVQWELLQCDSAGQNCTAKPCSSNTACGFLYESSDPTKTPTLNSKSGDTLIYQPPATFLSNSFSVEILAFAIAGQAEAQPASAYVQTSAFGNVLNGTYVFQAQGALQSGAPYQLAGEIVLDGNGNVTAGNQTFNTASLGSVMADSSQPNPGDTASACSQPPVPASCNYFYGSTYFVGPDGRGTIALNNMTDENGHLTTELFSLVVLSSSKAMIAHIANQYANSEGTTTTDPYAASGTLEAQTSTALPSGSYAFVSNGIDTGANAMDVAVFNSAPVPTVLGGILGIDGSGNIEESNSLADQDYYFLAGGQNPSAHPQIESCSPPSGLSGNVFTSAASSLPGVVIINLTGATCFSAEKNGKQSPASIAFTGYVVSADRIRIIESDVGASGSADYNVNGFFTLGVAVSQGSSAGTFTDASLSGQYVFSSLGFDFTNNSLLSSSFSSVAAVNADGGGNFTAGITDAYFKNASQVLSSTPLLTKHHASTYFVDSAGLGRVALTLRFEEPSPRPEIFFYLTGDGNPLGLYAGLAQTSYAAVGTGVAYLQAVNPGSLSFSGNYGIGFSQNNGSENDGSGQLTATLPAGSSPDTVTGTVDDTSNNLFNGNGVFPLADTFECPPGAASCPDSFGRYFYVDSSGVFHTTSLGNGGVYYMIDSTQGFFVETDAVDSTLGYFAAACDVTDPTGQSCGVAQNSAEKKSSRNRRGGSRAF